MSPALQSISKALTPFAPLLPSFSTQKIAGRMIAGIVTDTSPATGVYYNEKGPPMQASKQVSDSAFSDRFIAETCALPATLPTHGGC